MLSKMDFHAKEDLAKAKVRSINQNCPLWTGDLDLSEIFYQF